MNPSWYDEYDDIDPRYDDYDDGTWCFSQREREHNDRMDWADEQYERGSIDSIQRSEIRAGA